MIIVEYVLVDQTSVYQYYTRLDVKEVMRWVFQDLQSALDEKGFLWIEKEESPSCLINPDKVILVNFTQNNE